MQHWQAGISHGKVTRMFEGLIGLVAFLLVTGGSEAEQASPPPVRVMTVEQRLILRVPVRPRITPVLEWEEHKGPRCVPARAIAGALLAGDDSIDFVMRNRQRVRAKLGRDCEGLDFWDGFYMQPEGTEICAGRDLIRNRAGGTCEIRRFRMLRPVGR